MTSRPLIASLALAAAVVATPANGAGGGGGKGAPVAVEPLRVPIVDGGRIAGRLDVQMMIVADPKAHSDPAARMPVLRAAAVAALLDVASVDVSPRSPVDVAALTDRLQHDLHAVEPGVGAVLLVEVVARAE